ncbi:GTPase Obg [Streptomyces fumanus]
MPGLIPGASQGRGLGLEFLRHAQRCSVLVHVLDTATLESDRDPVSDLDIIEEELRQYGGLDDRPRLVVLNKIDVPDGKELAEMVRPDLEARGYRVFEVSAVAHLGLRELSFALAELVAGARAAKPKEEATRIVIRPKAVDDTGFTVTREEDGLFRVRGEKPERWVREHRLQQRRGRGLPRRPPRPPRRRGAVDEGRCPRGRRRGHRPRGQRGRLRLGAVDDGRRRDARPARRGPPLRRRGPPPSAAGTSRPNATRRSRSSRASSPSRTVRAVRPFAR